jgi:hypothetical protein
LKHIRRTLYEKGIFLSQITQLFFPVLPVGVEWVQPGLTSDNSGIMRSFLRLIIFL